MADGVATNDNFTVTLSITDSAGTAYDLTGDSVNFRYVLNEVFKSVAMTLASATGGVVTYVFPSTDLDAGTVTYEVDVIDGASDVLTSISQATFTVRAKLDSG